MNLANLTIPKSRVHECQLDLLLFLFFTIWLKVIWLEQCFSSLTSAYQCISRECVHNVLTRPHHLSFVCPTYVSSPSLCSSDKWKIPFLLSFAIFKWYASIISIFEPSRMVTINLLFKFHFLTYFTCLCTILYLWMPENNLKRMSYFPPCECWGSGLLESAFTHWTIS